MRATDIEILTGASRLVLAQPGQSVASVFRRSCMRMRVCRPLLLPKDNTAVQSPRKW